MGCCTDLTGNSSCGFHYSGLPCPLGSSTQRINPSYSAALDTFLFEHLSLSDQPAPSFIRRGPPNCQFLALPGEIRNRIYRAALVIANPFAVQLHWNGPLDTALLRANKQIFDEASGIFYAENTFRFPEALFIGAPILHQLQTLYRVSRLRLRMMRSVVLDVPIYGILSNSGLRAESLANFRQLTEFLACSPTLKVQLRLGYVWGENCRYLGPWEYLETLDTALVYLQSSKVDMDVHVKTHPRFMDEWVDLLNRKFPEKWSLEAIFQLYSPSQIQLSFNAVIGFSSRYQVPGLKEFYEEAWSTKSYIFKPRRVPFSGSCAETIA